jgi:hypothetical protein
MREFRLAGAFGLAAFVCVSASTVLAAKGSVQETSPTCSNASAVLLTGNAVDADGATGRIRAFLEAKRVWTIGGVQPGVAGTVDLASWEVTNPKTVGPTNAWGVKCGSGGTCNEVAKAFADAHADLTPAPFVLCGEVNGILK